MPGPILHMGAVVTCAHGGQAVPTAPSPNVLVSGMPVVTIAAPYAVAGCALRLCQGDLRRRLGAGIGIDGQRDLRAAQHRRDRSADLRLRGRRMIYACCDEKRKAAVLGNPTLNGIDFVEVLDREETVQILRQRTLLVHCLKPVPTSLVPSNVLIEGGESVVGIGVEWVAPASAPPASATADENAIFAALPSPANVLVVRTDKAGDFSPYILRLVNDASQAAQDSFAVTESLAGFDPQLAGAGFSFKVECGPDFDCAPTTDCAP